MGLSAQVGRTLDIAPNTLPQVFAALGLLPHLASPLLPTGHLRARRERRKLPREPSTACGRPPEVAGEAGRLHPVGRFRVPSFIGRQRDHPGDEIEHGKSPRGLEVSGPRHPIPSPGLTLGKPPCTRMALSQRQNESQVVLRFGTSASARLWKILLPALPGGSIRIVG